MLDEGRIEGYGGGASEDLAALPDPLGVGSQDARTLESGIELRARDACRSAWWPWCYEARART